MEVVKEIVFDVGLEVGEEELIYKSVVLMKLRLLRIVKKL